VFPSTRFIVPSRKLFFMLDTHRIPISGSNTLRDWCKRYYPDISSGNETVALAVY
jgi:hypothetical protein